MNELRFELLVDVIEKYGMDSEGTKLFTKLCKETPNGLMGNMIVKSCYKKLMK